MLFRSRRSAPRSNFTPVVPPVPRGEGTAARLGAGLTQTVAPSLRKEKERGKKEEPEDEREVYSDPDEGVEIVDMEDVRQMDWMAPESLRKEKEAGKKKKVAKVEREEGAVKTEDTAQKGAHICSSFAYPSICRWRGHMLDQAMEVDEAQEEAVNMANAVDLSESEEEEELEDIIDDFAQVQEQEEVSGSPTKPWLYPDTSSRRPSLIQTFDKNVYISSSSPNRSPLSSRPSLARALTPRAKARQSPGPAMTRARRSHLPKTQNLPPTAPQDQKRLPRTQNSTASSANWKSTRAGK